MTASYAITVPGQSVQKAEWRSLEATLRTLHGHTESSQIRMTIWVKAPLYNDSKPVLFSVYPFIVMNFDMTEWVEKDLMNQKNRIDNFSEKGSPTKEDFQKGLDWLRLVMFQRYDK